LFRQRPLPFQLNIRQRHRHRHFQSPRLHPQQQQRNQLSKRQLALPRFQMYKIRQLMSWVADIL
jgi:hypothetical protein